MPGTTWWPLSTKVTYHVGESASRLFLGPTGATLTSGIPWDGAFSSPCPERWAGRTLGRQRHPHLPSCRRGWPALGLALSGFVLPSSHQFSLAPYENKTVLFTLKAHRRGGTGPLSVLLGLWTPVVNMFIMYDFTYRWDLKYEQTGT